MRRFIGGRVVVLLVVSSLIAAACSTGTSPSDLIQVREGHTATLLENGQVLAVGGDWESTPDSEAVLSSAELYDPSTGTWFDAASMAEPRSDHTATLLTDGRVLVAGGGSGQFIPNVIRPLATAEVYDPATNTWTQTGSMKECGTVTQPLCLQMVAS